MALGAEAGRAGDGGRGGGDRSFEPGRCGNVLDHAARRADQVVMVAGEVFGELPPRELVGAHDAMHDAGLLEHHEVAVHRALREPGTPIEHLGDGEGSGRGGERVDQHFAVGGEPLAHTPQPSGDRNADRPPVGMEVSLIPTVARRPSHRSGRARMLPRSGLPSDRGRDRPIRRDRQRAGIGDRARRSRVGHCRARASWIST